MSETTVIEGGFDRFPPGRGQDRIRRTAKTRGAPLGILLFRGSIGHLGLPDAEDKQTKVHLAAAINQIIETMGLSQTATAERLHLNQPKISALTNYRLSGFSVERLIDFLNALS